MDITEKVYSVTLSDGTVLTNLKVNGTNFISESEINSEMFDGKCNTITVYDGETSTVYKNIEIVHVTDMNGEYWFSFRMLTTKEVEDMKLRSDIEYLAMMTGIEL